MREPLQRGRDLIGEIDSTLVPAPTLWWLGQSGFVIRFAHITFYIDPCLSELPGRTRLLAAPLDGADVHHADLILATHVHPGHLDPQALIPMLSASRTAKVVLPKSGAERAHAAGIPYDRMTTTDSGLRVEYFKDRVYGRVYAIPSAHPELDWTAGGGYPYLGYLIRFGRWTIYHAGDCVPYEGLADRLKPFNVNVALLPVGGRNFSVSQAAQLAADIGSTWIVPMHYGTFVPVGETDGGTESNFITHMLGHRPEQAFKVFQCGEKWTVPED